DLDGKLDLFVANYINFEKDRIPLPGTTPDCRWKGVAVMCGPRGLPGGTNQLFHNEGNGTFRNVSERSGIAAVGARYSLSVTTLPTRRDGASASSIMTMPAGQTLSWLMGTFTPTSNPWFPAPSIASAPFCTTI